MRKRSARELYFRLRQESANLRLYLAPPGLASTPPGTLALPDAQLVADSLRGSSYAHEMERLAEQIAAGRLPILGFTIDFDGRWRRDPINKIESAPEYFRRIPYLDASAVGDHKIIWEFNRHQHWVALAQTFVLTGRTEFLKTIQAQFESWVNQNPYLRGINWTSALEVAFRTMSWIWVYHLAGDRMDDAWRTSFLEQLYRHGRYLEHNLSVYFSPNTHLLGEAVALHALGVLFPIFPRSSHWRRLGGSTVERALIAQVRDDGSHFEQSSYYHVYTLDMALTWFLNEGRPARFRTRIERMAGYLHTLMGSSNMLPFLGDDDGGRWFHPYGERDKFGRATLGTCSILFERADWTQSRDNFVEQAAWWLGPASVTVAEKPQRSAESRSQLFADSGIAVMRSADVQVIAKAGPLGAGSGGHSHADALSIVAHNGDEEILIDPGTFTYIGEAEARTWFRQSAAHSTITIDGLGQATTAGPFRWTDPASVDILKWTSNPDRDFLDARCRYRGLTHQRRFFFLRSSKLLLVIDDVEGPPGAHLIEQFWHLGIEPIALADRTWRIGAHTVLTIAPGIEVELETAWRSRAFGVREKAPILRAHRQSELPIKLAAALDFSGTAEPSTLKIENDLIFQSSNTSLVINLDGPEPKILSK